MRFRRVTVIGFSQMTVMGLLVSPWIVVAALLRQIKDEARKLALTVELERSQYERNALDIRLRLLQAQVAPHFLFNTLANVRELVSTAHSTTWLKPVEVARLKARLRGTPDIPDTGALLDQLAARVLKNATPTSLRWLRVSVGQALRLVAADEIDFLRSEDKYTLVAWHDPAGVLAEGLIRTPLKELIHQLDPEQFVPPPTISS